MPNVNDISCVSASGYWTHLCVLVIRISSHAPQVLHGLKALFGFDTAPLYALQPRGSDTQQQVGQARVLLLLNVSNVAHHYVDQGVLHQRQEHKHCTPRHEHIYCLNKIEVLDI